MNSKKLISILCLIMLSVNCSFAIQDVTYDENIQSQYTDEIHSVFSLNDCINIAVQNNPEIRAAIHNEDIYKSKIGQAWSNYFPVLNAGFDVSRTGNKYTHVKNSSAMYKTNYNTVGYVPSVSANMLLFDFGKTKAVADIAKSMYQASKEDTKAGINTIIYDIKATYYNILFAQAQVMVYEDTVKDYQLQMEQAKGFYEFGVKPKIDVVTAEYNLGKAQLNLVKAKNILKVARVQLSKIMGIPEYTNYELSDELTLNVCDINLEDAIKKAMEVRPELISAEQSTKAAKIALRASKRAFTPDLGAYGSYGNGIGNNYDIRSAQIGIGLKYSGLNLMQSKKELDEAKAEYKKSQAAYESVKDSVYLNVKKNYLDLETAREAILIAKLALDQAEEQYKQVTGRYKAGVGDAIELKDGENTYLSARLDFYNAMLNYNITAASLEREIGTPLSFTDEKILDLSNEVPVKEEVTGNTEEKSSEKEAPKEILEEIPEEEVSK